jgi:hypothetical protein
MPVSEREAGKNTVLVFPHIPKTGGTTLLYHFRKFFGDSKVLILGPHGRVRSFFEGRPQFEELSPQRLSEVRLVQGHGVGEDTLRSLIQADKEPKLITVLRNPLSLTRSRFNHKANAVEHRGGGSLQAADFLKQDAGSVMCRLLTAKFPSFVEQGTGDLAAAGLSVLQKFNYVFVTEQMDQQVKSLMNHLKLPDQLERRRVAQSRKDLAISDDELALRHAEDLQLFGEVNHLIDSNGTCYNPAGFQPGAQKDLFDQLASGVEARPAYDRLVRGLCTELLVEAALVKLEMQGEDISVADPAAFERTLMARWEVLQAALLPVQRELSRDKATAMRQRLTRAAHKKQRLGGEICR